MKLTPDICSIISSYIYKPSKYELLDWISIDKLNWDRLSYNINAIDLLTEYNLEGKDKINWSILSYNINAIHLLEKNIEKINWRYLSENPNAIHLL